MSILDKTPRLKNVWRKNINNIWKVHRKKNSTTSFSSECPMDNVHGRMEAAIVPPSKPVFPEVPAVSAIVRVWNYAPADKMWRWEFASCEYRKQMKFRMRTSCETIANYKTFFLSYDMKFKCLVLKMPIFSIFSSWTYQFIVEVWTVGRIKMER